MNESSMFDRSIQLDGHWMSNENSKLCESKGFVRHLKLPRRKWLNVMTKFQRFNQRTRIPCSSPLPTEEKFLLVWLAVWSLFSRWSPIGSVHVHWHTWLVILSPSVNRKLENDVSVDQSFSAVTKCVYFDMIAQNLLHRRNVVCDSESGI